MFFAIAKPFRARSGQPDFCPAGGPEGSWPRRAQHKTEQNHELTTSGGRPEHRTAGHQKGRGPLRRDVAWGSWSRSFLPPRTPGSSSVGCGRPPRLSGLGSGAGNPPSQDLSEGNARDEVCGAIEKGRRGRDELDRAISPEQTASQKAQSKLPPILPHYTTAAPKKKSFFAGAASTGERLVSGREIG